MNPCPTAAFCAGPFIYAEKPWHSEPNRITGPVNIDGTCLLSGGQTYRNSPIQERSSGRRERFAASWKPIPIPPRPEVIRQRYARLFKRQALFLEAYKRFCTGGMNRRFADPGKMPPAK